MAKNVVAAIFKSFCRLNVEGRENIPKSGGFLIAANHLSFLDPPLLAVASPRQLSFAAKADLFENRPFFGHLIGSLGAFPIARGGYTLSFIKVTLSLLRKGRPVALFPEGTRSKDGSLGRPYSGVGFLAIKGKVPVIPTLIRGADKALPREGKIVRPRKVEVIFGKPLFPDYFEKGNLYQEMSREVMKEIKELHG